MTRVHASFWAALCALLVLAPASAVSASSGQPSLTVAFLPVEPVMQAAYADARGFFVRQGLDVDLRVVSDPALIAPAVVSGDVQFAATTVGGLAFQKTRGLPVKLVASGALYRPQAPTTALVAGVDSGIRRVRDLRGKTIGIDARTTLAHVGLLKWLKQNGLSEGDVTIAELRGFQQLLGPLRRGQVDAAVLPEPYLTQSIRQGGRRVAPILDTTCAKDCLITLWIARKDVDPNLAARFRNAIQQAAVWANAKKNWPASGRILTETAGVPPALIGRITRTSFSTRLRPAQAQPVIDIYAEFGLIPASFDAGDLVR
jgi:NitT/TauT family transport system substrate-binding protein